MNYSFERGTDLISPDPGQELLKPIGRVFDAFLQGVYRTGGAILRSEGLVIVHDEKNPNGEIESLRGIVIDTADASDEDLYFTGSRHHYQAYTWTVADKPYSRFPAHQDQLIRAGRVLQPVLDRWSRLTPGEQDRILADLRKDRIMRIGRVPLQRQGE